MKTNIMRVYLDNIVFSIQKFGGASTYWQELLKRFVSKENVILISQNEDKPIFDIDGELFDYKSNKNSFLLEKTFKPKFLRYLPLTKRLPKGSLYHNSYYRTCFQKSVVNIFTIHDFAHKKGYASSFPRNVVHIGLTSIGLKNADGIIAISENTKKDLLFYYPNIPENKIKVIYHGVNEDFYPLEKIRSQMFKDQLNLDDRYVLFIGKRGGYKNFDLVVQALSAFNDIKLVIVGGEKMNDEEYNNLISKLPSGFLKFDGLENEEINLLYNYAFSLVYPSKFEGFGFPIVEAMRSGCPVITTTLTSIPEVAGDAALYIEDSSHSLIQKITELRSDNIRTSFIERGFRQSRKFSWEKCASETFQFYQDIYNSKYGL
jgi:glycosyltransferase involved in cell wall biosynthesis